MVTPRMFSRIFAVIIFLITCGQSLLAAEAAMQKIDFDGFPAARSEILGLISGATNQIRIATDFLSDGEIVSALYIAQYRKVDVQVMIGSSKANHVLSRLGYLKTQNIPVWIRPRGFLDEYSTVIFSDGRLFSFNGELDYTARHRKFSLAPLGRISPEDFLQRFNEATQSSVSPEAKPLPLVGRPRYRKSTVTSTGAKATPSPVATQMSPPTDSSPRGEGAYRYNLKRDKPDQTIPTKLPKTTILQNKSQDANH